MSQYIISKVHHTDLRTIAEVDTLLSKEGIRRDANLDYTCVMYDEDYHVIATGSCFGNTLRCFAVRSDHQGEGLLNEIVTHLMEIEFERGYVHLFLYTKIKSAAMFRDLGFYEIGRVNQSLVFMENRKNGFHNYLKKLLKESGGRKEGISAAIVMNANPFTLGHQYLIEHAAYACETVHIFLLSEDVSLVPLAVRKKLVKEGIADFSNVILHESGPYIISNATFPSYFLKDEMDVIDTHAKLDLEVFAKIAETLQITRRYVGEEPFSLVTGRYNAIMKEKLPEKGIECVVLPRKECKEAVISASTVRELIAREDWKELKQYVPQSTWNYFQSEESKAVVDRIQKADQVRHY